MRPGFQILKLDLLCLAVCASGHTTFWTRSTHDIDSWASVRTLFGFVQLCFTHALPDIHVSSLRALLQGLAGHVKQKVRLTGSCIEVGLGFKWGWFSRIRPECIRLPERLAPTLPNAAIGWHRNVLGKPFRLPAPNQKKNRSSGGLRNQTSDDATQRCAQCNYEEGRRRLNTSSWCLLETSSEG